MSRGNGDVVPNANEGHAKLERLCIFATNGRLEVSKGFQIMATEPM